MEAEYVSLSACCAQVISMRAQLLDYGYSFNKTLMYCDSKSAIAISCNPQVWHNLRLDDSKKRFIFFIDTKEFTFLVDDFRRVFQLPQATDNNHAGFVEPLTFTAMLPFFLNKLGYATRIRLAGQFATKDLSQPWQPLEKIFSRCLTTRVTDVPTTLSQPIEYTQGTIRTPSAPRPPNPAEHKGESSALRKPTLIRIRRRSQPNPKTPIPTPAEIDVTNIDKATQMSIAIAKSIEDLEAWQNVKRYEEHMVDEEIEKIVKGNDDVDENQFVDDILNNQEDPGTRIEPESHQERPKVEKSVDSMITDE
uniref:Ribonuclease H-like domain-containing protein n=1 Tax=Tanacetum cinerariifolium TaxID=118510 RepID=A0A699GR55_TANCI|nr:ribonuclease H-like domain-containing protein [Tanacetum cinerariifolium]